MPTDYEPQRGSESETTDMIQLFIYRLNYFICTGDLNALLTLYSCPPDPIMSPSRCPPPGAPTYQGVPQGYTMKPNMLTPYYLRKHSSSPSILGVSPTASYPPDVLPYVPYDVSYGASSMSRQHTPQHYMHVPTPMSHYSSQAPYQGIAGLMRRTPSPLLGGSSLLDYDTSDAVMGTAGSTNRTYGTQWASANHHYY